MKIYGTVLCILAAAALSAGHAAWAGECKEFIELHTAPSIAKKLGKSEDWVFLNHKISLWDRPTREGKGRAVGRLLPGSRALILDSGIDDYKVRSPRDESTGWISRDEVRRVIRLDTVTMGPCQSNRIHRGR
jgi:hypothetical protein